MPQILYMKREFLENAICATYLLSDELLPSDMNDVDIQISPRDLEALGGGDEITLNNPPLIGVLLAREKQNYSIDEPYLQALVMNGARFRLIHYDNIEKQCCNLDGILLIGGFFPTPPAWYINPKSDDAPPSKRTNAYLKLLEIADKQKIPVLGICGGMQMMAGFYGAKISRSTPSKGVEHRLIRADKYAHDIKIAPNSILAQIALENLQAKVNSVHSEMVAEVPQNTLKISAWANDGVIEAIEICNPKHFALGVQWHPERMALNGDDFAKAIYARFCDEARNFQCCKKNSSN